MYIGLGTIIFLIILFYMGRFILRLAYILLYRWNNTPQKRLARAMKFAKEEQEKHKQESLKKVMGME
jgi:hypothetical protein